MAAKSHLADFGQRVEPQARWLDPVAIIGYWVLRFNLANPRAPPRNWGPAVHGTVSAQGPSEKKESPASDLNEDAKPQTTKSLDDDPATE